MNAARRPVKSIAVRLIRRVARDRRGATAIEYGLIVALIVIAMMAAFNSVAAVTTGMWSKISDEVVSRNAATES